MKIIIKLTCSIFFMSSDNFFFFAYIKMSKGSPGKYDLNNKEQLQEKARERYQSLFKEEK